jgi:endo-1,4-beta-D-glucanase Y
MGDKTLFDQLWKGYRDHRNGNGVMHWTVNCSGTVSANGATDGDLDAAMALLVANKQWPNTTSPYNYSSDATALINAIKATEFTTCNGKTVQKPGDMFGGCDCTNPSYFATGYYRAFGKHVTADAAFWEKAANDGLALLLTATILPQD